ncbi:MAG: protein kinase, partial [Vicinamibacterales bacterium]|nr:protein kinase [Vicinamibacterales bacterium]
MVLSEGRRLGPCEIQASIGAGGMGEVCKALDTRLDRTVAIRVLPDHVGAEANLRHRLEREAKAISRLSQPTIRTRHDIGTQDGTPFLVMEYLDGEALSERIGREPLPLAEAVQHDLALLGTLEARHGQSLVHRDLKPSNIFLAANGLKLLLDRDTVCDQHPPS